MQTLYQVKPYVNSTRVQYIAPTSDHLYTHVRTFIRRSSATDMNFKRPVVSIIHGAVLF